MPVELVGLVGATVKAWRGSKAEPYRQMFKVPPGDEDFGASIVDGRATLNVDPGREAIAFILGGGGELLRVIGVMDGRTRSIPQIDSMTPNSAQQNTGPVSVTLIGFGFTDSTEVIFDREVIAPERVKRTGSTKLVGVIDTNFKDPYKLHRVVVANAGARSPAETFTITP